MDKDIDTSCSAKRNADINRNLVDVIFQYRYVRYIICRTSPSRLSDCVNLAKNSAVFLNELIQKELLDSAPALVAIDDYLEENCHAVIEYSHDRSRTVSCRSTVTGSILKLSPPAVNRVRAKSKV